MKDMLNHPRLGIAGTALLLAGAGVSIFFDDTSVIIDLGVWNVAISGGWAILYIFSALSLLLWTIEPKSRVLYYGTILSVTIAIWSRSVVLLIEQMAWVRPVAWILVLWLLMNLMPRWKIQLLYPSLEVEADAAD